MAVSARMMMSEDGSLPQAALDDIPAAVMVLDSRGEVLFASAPTEKVLGGPVRNLAADTLSSDSFPRGEVFKILLEACGSGMPVSRLVTFERQTRHYLQVSAAPLTGAPGGGKTAALVVDLTAAVMQGDIATEFVHQVRHDLRGPLTSIRGAAELLLTERLGRLEEKQKKIVELVEKAAQQMTRQLSGVAAPAIAGGKGPDPESGEV
jgi:signal transduction histidine kinase